MKTKKSPVGRESLLDLICFFETDAIANVSSGSTVKYFDKATSKNGKVAFSDSEYPNPIAAIAPAFVYKATLLIQISRVYYDKNEHYWIASSPDSSMGEGITVRVFYI